MPDEQRISELLAYNNRQVERRRAIKSEYNRLADRVKSVIAHDPTLRRDFADFDLDANPDIGDE